MDSSPWFDEFPLNSSVCPWLGPNRTYLDSGVFNQFVCFDGSTCDIALDGPGCCNCRGGRKLCPLDTVLLSESTCAGGVDWCCLSKNFWTEEMHPLSCDPHISHPADPSNINCSPPQPLPPLPAVPPPLPPNPPAPPCPPPSPPAPPFAPGERVVLDEQSLRDAIADENAHTIFIDAAASPVVLGSTLHINRDVHVRPLTLGTLVLIDARATQGEPHPVVQVATGSAVVLEQLIVKGGASSACRQLVEEFDGYRNASLAAGVDNAGELRLLQCTITGNLGSGIRNTGTLHLDNSIVYGNGDALVGGGIWNLGGNLNVSHSEIKHNRACAIGGGIFHVGAAARTLIRFSTVSNNAAVACGGIDVGDSQGWTRFGNQTAVSEAWQHMRDYMYNETMANADAVAAMEHSQLVLADSKIIDNEATYTGGIGARRSTTTMIRTVIARNRAQSRTGGLYVNMARLFAREINVSSNRAQLAGGIFVDGGDQEGGLVFSTSSIVTHNWASQSGGVRITGPASYLHGTGLNISENEALNNRSQLEIVNGAVLLSNGSVVIGNDAMGLFNGGQLHYALPAPMGHFGESPFTCEPLMCGANKCRLRAHALFPVPKELPLPYKELVQQPCCRHVVTSMNECLACAERCNYTLHHGAVISRMQMGDLALPYPPACDRGAFGNSTVALQQSTSQCSGACPLFHYCPLPATVKPTPCPAGHFTLERGADHVLQCSSCGDDRYLNTSRSGDVEWVASWIRWVSNGGSPCYDCPPDTTTRGGGTRIESIAACACKRGFYSVLPTSKLAGWLAANDVPSKAPQYCKECPTGMSCNAVSNVSLASAEVQRGFWRPSSNSFPRQCPFEGLCIGGTTVDATFNSSSTDGCLREKQVRGPFCMLCVDDSHIFNRVLVQCQASETPIVVMILALLMTIVALYLCGRRLACTQRCLLRAISGNRPCSRWVDIGPTPPFGYSENIRNEPAKKLSQALQEQQTEFTLRELDDFGIRIEDLQETDIVRAGESYFQPVILNALVDLRVFRVARFVKGRIVVAFHRTQYPIKICVSFYQIIVQMPSVFRTHMPPAYEAMLAEIDLLVDSFLPIPDLDFLFGQRLGARLLLFTSAPLIGMVVSFLVAWVWHATEPVSERSHHFKYREDRWNHRRLRSTCFQALVSSTPVWLLLFFIMATPISSLAFRALRECECFQEVDEKAFGEGAYEWSDSRLTWTVRNSSTTVHSVCFSTEDLELRCPAGQYLDGGGNLVRVSGAEIGVDEAWRYRRTMLIASFAMYLYALGVPAAFLGLLIFARVRGEILGVPGLLGGSLAFLYAEYNENAWLWEVWMTMIKNVLAGFISLSYFAPGSARQLVLALVVSLAHLTLCAWLKPYRQPHLNGIAIVAAASIQLLFIAFLTYLLQQRYGIDLGILQRFVFPVASLFVIALGVIVMAIFSYHLIGRRPHTVVWSRDGVEAQVRLPHAGGHHLFLSHAWSSGQDQTKTLQLLLNELLPSMRIFLDVASALKRAAGSSTAKPVDWMEANVRASSTMVAVLTGREEKTPCSDYFSSNACIHELAMALSHEKRVVFLQETDPAHGAVPLVKHARECQRIFRDSCKPKIWRRVYWEDLPPERFDGEHRLENNSLCELVRTRVRDTLGFRWIELDVDSRQGFGMGKEITSRPLEEKLRKRHRPHFTHNTLPQLTSARDGTDCAIDENCFIRVGGRCFRPAHVFDSDLDPSEMGAIRIEDEEWIELGGESLTRRISVDSYLEVDLRGGDGIVLLQPACNLDAKKVYDELFRGLTLLDEKSKEASEEGRSDERLEEHLNQKLQRPDAPQRSSAVVRWHRYRELQAVSVRLVAEHVLQEEAVRRGDAGDTICVLGDLGEKAWRLPRRSGSGVDGPQRPWAVGAWDQISFGRMKIFHLYVSEANLGANSFMGYLEDMCKEYGLVDWSQLRVTTNPADMHLADYFLLYLSADTWKSLPQPPKQFWNEILEDGRKSPEEAQWQPASKLCAELQDSEESVSVLLIHEMRQSRRQPRRAASLREDPLASPNPGTRELEPPVQKQADAEGYWRGEKRFQTINKATPDAIRRSRFQSTALPFLDDSLEHERACVDLILRALCQSREGVWQGKLKPALARWYEGARQLWSGAQGAWYDDEQPEEIRWMQPSLGPYSEPSRKMSRAYSKSMHRQSLVSPSAKSRKYTRGEGSEEHGRRARNFSRAAPDGELVGQVEMSRF